uniref:Rhodanese domain-containing protein n=1 Tax=Globisporangium ultimum (strain ATCC 200006 / CBS 805.95 / DAOM BR144) TaxID=431595 RepID=K3WGX3_GLOUD
MHECDGGADAADSASERCARCQTLEAQLRELQRSNDALREQLAHLFSPAPEANSSRPPHDDTPTSPADTYSSLTRLELQRYGRQMLVRDFGVASQMKLRDARVLIVGVGGLGSPVAMYLGAMGVAHLTLVDGDHVERSNLHRQVIHDESSLETKKVHSAQKRLARINPDVECRALPVRLTTENALELVKQHDVVVDASDNVGTRYLVNDACAIARKPLVSGSALGMEGQVAVFDLDNDASTSGCYRCLYPTPQQQPQSCEENGVVGVVPGIIGCLQAMETIKVLTGMGKPLVGVQCLYDAYDGQVRRLKLGASRKRDCLACGAARIGSLRSELLVCSSSISSDVPKLPSTSRISVQAFAAYRQKHAPTSFVLVDTRPRTQFDMVHFPEAVHVPFDKVFMKKTDRKALLAACGLALPTCRQKKGDGTNFMQQKPVFVICRRGVDSVVATQLLLASGVSNVQNVDGGYTEYARSVDPIFPMY